MMISAVRNPCATGRLPWHTRAEMVTRVLLPAAFPGRWRVFVGDQPRRWRNHDRGDGGWGGAN